VERYIGLDAHGTSCTFGVIGPSGRKLRHDVVETNGAALVSYLRQRPRPEASVPGGGDAERLVVRDPLAARQGDRGRRHRREQRPEERCPGCVSTRRGAAGWDNQDDRLQGAAVIQSVAGARTRAHDARARRGTGATSAESDVPRARYRNTWGDGLQPEQARTVVEAIAHVVPLGYGDTPRGVRLPAGSQAEDGEGASGRSPQTSDLEGSGHGAGLGANPGGPASADRGYPSPFSYAQSVLVLLRTARASSRERPRRSSRGSIPTRCTSTISD
jgi:hypothetical protein